MELPPSSYHDSLEELWDEEEEPEEIDTVMKVVPSTSHQYLDVFYKVKAEKLPPHSTCDHHIKLEGSLPPVGVIYSLSKQESDTVRAYISENVEKGFIWPSSSSTGGPVLFAQKKDGGLNLCVEYRKLNAVTKKNKYPVPPMNQLLKVLNGSPRLICVNLVNDIFQDLLDVYVMVYLDYIIVFSKSEEEHATHVSTVLSRLRANILFAKASKCLFHVSSVEYLGYVVSSEGLKMDQENVQQILNWPSPRNIKALQSFLGFVNVYRRFIKNYSKKISSLNSFLKKDCCFTLNEEALREHIIAFDSHKLFPEELNYEINDKELLQIVWALKRWTAFLLSLSSPFEVLTDHSSLQYFMSSKVLTRWAEFLSEFHF
ncbi:hypothetical protein O181_047033 [Austropuccinia psidii MF-1]|uniref:Reverse transcriptase RNase H-like domain-containing protein n=1 Tax=Austropuccinia psidii MF-1 TaxID=1389203 RepID=A0A9Q3DTE8_9BASI|nr:hypothetical protein [Austropuccinia psidii MF-1]